MKPTFCLFPLALGTLCTAAPVMPGLVTIRSTAKRQDPSGVRSVNSSLGFIVEKDGYLLTNYSNLTDVDSGRLLDDFQVSLTDGSGRTFTASVIGVEPTINLGILKIGAGETFEVAKVQTSRQVEVGAALKAVSEVGEKGVECTEGIVAGLNTRECYQESLTSTMFRAKIDIPAASMGGPVITAANGEVVAIYTGFKPTADEGHVEGEGETHLLPINLCFNVYDSIKQKGSMKSPWTGFSVRPIHDAEKHFFPTAKKHHGGVGIEYVWPGSPAEKMGLRENDILVQFSYNRILSVADFQKWLYMFGVGQPVKLMILRDGKDYLISDYVIEERPKEARPK